MSSTAFSYIDDGRSFTRRLPPTTPHASISHWLSTTHSDATSAYTGSYIDDGLDLLPSTGPGFGAVNTRFYKHKKRRDQGDGHVPWNDDIARAIGGDMERNLAKLRDISRVEVKRPDVDAGEEKKRRDKKKGVVTVPAPLRWGTFVIRDESGRCIVIDERGEYDSGAVNQTMENPRESRRWVEAARSPSPPVYPPPPPQKDKVRQLGGGEKESRSRRKSKVKTSRERRRPRTLSPVPESNYSSSSDDTVKVSAASPTAFIMTGGLSGWPSPMKSSRAISPERLPIVPHAITWDDSTSPHAYSAGSASASRSKLQRRSGRILPHGWPSAPASPTNSVCSSTFTHLKAPSSGKNSSAAGSRHTRSDHGSKRHDRENQEFGSNYQPPDIIEVIYDETPPGEVSYSQAGWGGGAAVSARSWNEAHEDEKFNADAWQGVADAGIVKSFGHGSADSDLGWGGSAKESGWEGSKAGNKSQSIHSWDVEKHSNDGGNGEDEWDGFERLKSTSEISVAGGSERSWPASQHSIHTVQTQRSQRSRTSPRSSMRRPTDWTASQAESKEGSTVHWGGSAIQGEQDWPASEHRNHSWAKSEDGSNKSSASKYQNGFDEDDATYLKDTWGGIPVRVASPHTSVVGWG